MKWPDLSAIPPRGDVLLIVPPFAFIDRPSLAAHLLQACAGEAGFRLVVFYANIHLAAVIGVYLYDALWHSDSSRAFLCERFFCRAAFGGPVMGRNRLVARREFDSFAARSGVQVGWQDVERAARGAEEWADQVASAVSDWGYRIVAATSSFAQSGAAIALLDRVKRRRPESLTLLGGANCEGSMAEGMGSLAPRVDYVFSGESESTFPSFLRDHGAGILPDDRIVRGDRCCDLNRLPPPRFTEFFEQMACWLPEETTDGTWLPYESSRGCWWGEKQRCTFCGLNGLRTSFREKAPDRVRDELASIADRHPGCGVTFTDSVVSRSYFSNLWPRLAEEGSTLELFCEQRPGLSLDDIVVLKRAGVTTIQIGAEALSPTLLRRLSKGFPVEASIRVLRYARAVKLAVYWNLLYGIPGDRLEEYEETLALLPLLRHLAPATNLSRIRLDKFSRYAEEPEEFGIRDLSPVDEYANVYPSGTKLRELAYFLRGEFSSDSRENRKLVDRLADEIDTARELWARGGEPPLLLVKKIGDHAYVLSDTRGVAKRDGRRVVGRDQAMAALAAGPDVPSSAKSWALEHKVGVQLSGRYVPLATAAPELLREFEEEAFNRMGGLEKRPPLDDVLPVTG